MTLAITLLALVSGVVVSLALSSIRLAKAVPPAVLVRLLAVGSLVGAATVGLVLVLTGLAVVGRIPAVAAIDGWSVTTLAETVPVPPVVGAPAAVLGAVLLARAVWRTSCIAAQLVRSHRLSRQLRGDGGPVVVVDDDTADAYAVSGLPGCVVLSRRLLRALSPLERRLVTAHELSHLRHRHHLYVHAVDVAVAANPLLRPVAKTVRLGVERWADEDAARVAEDRRSAATAVASAALARVFAPFSDTRRPPTGGLAGRRELRHPARGHSRCSNRCRGAASSASPPRSCW